MNSPGFLSRHGSSWNTQASPASLPPRHQLSSVDAGLAKTPLFGPAPQRHDEEFALSHELKPAYRPGSLGAGLFSETPTSRKKTRSAICRRGWDHAGCVVPSAEGASMSAWRNCRLPRDRVAFPGRRMDAVHLDVGVLLWATTAVSRGHATTVRGASMGEGALSVAKKPKPHPASCSHCIRRMAVTR